MSIRSIHFPPAAAAVQAALALAGANVRAQRVTAAAPSSLPAPPAPAACPRPQAGQPEA